MNELKNNVEKSDILVKVFMNHSYGDIILHSEIENAIDCKINSSQYGTVIQKTRKILLEKHNRAIRNIRGQGYEIVSPDKFTDYSLGFYKRGINTLKKGRNHLENAPVNDMSQESLEIYRRVNDRAIRLQAAMAGVSVELKSLAKRNHPFANLSDNSSIRKQES